MIKFGQRLKLLRLKKGWKQEHVARVVSVTPEMISAYENGKNDPRLDTLVTLADLYDVSVDYLVGRTNIPTMADCKTVEVLELLSLNELTYEGVPLTEEEQKTLVDIVKSILAFARAAKVRTESIKEQEPVIPSMAAYGDIDKMVQEKVEAVKEELRQIYRKEREEANTKEE